MKVSLGIFVGILIGFGIFWFGSHEAYKLAEQERPKLVIYCGDDHIDEFGERALFSAESLFEAGHDPLFHLTYLVHNNEDHTWHFETETRTDCKGIIYARKR